MTRFVVEQLLAGTTLYWKVFKPFCKGWRVQPIHQKVVFPGRYF